MNLKIQYLLEEDLKIHRGNSMKHFLKVKDIKDIVLKEYGKAISNSKAYEIIRILNLELEEKNILTIRGAVSEKYFNARKKIIVQLLKGVKKN